MCVCCRCWMLRSFYERVIEWRKNGKERGEMKREFHWKGNLEWLPDLSGAKGGGTSVGPIPPGEKQQTEAQKQAQSGCAAKALAAGGMAALSNYVPIPLAARPSPMDYQDGSAVASTAIATTGDFLAAGGKAAVSVGLRNGGFAIAADALDAVPFLGEAVMVIQAGKAAYDGVNAMIETMDQCSGVQ